MKENMANQLSLCLDIEIKTFSAWKYCRDRKCLNSLLENVTLNEENATDTKTDYAMTFNKLRIWPDDSFQLLNTPGGIVLRARLERNMGTNWCEARNILLLGIKSMNKVTIRCKIWHRSYLLRLRDDKQLQLHNLRVWQEIRSFACVHTVQP